MMWIRRRPTARDSAAAGITALTLAAGVGLATFYVVRLFLSREPLTVPEPGGRTAGERDREGAGA